MGTVGGDYWVYEFGPDDVDRHPFAGPGAFAPGWARTPAWRMSFTATNFAPFAGGVRGGNAGGSGRRGKPRRRGRPGGCARAGETPAAAGDFSRQSLPAAGGGEDGRAAGR